MSAPRLWDWAAAAYARPGVSEACLDLQDACGQSVPFLLWAAWTAAAGRPVPAAVMAGAARAAKAWEGKATGPIRAARRALKAPDPTVPDAARQALRAEVKALELKAERTLMEALEALAPAAAGPPGDLAAVLAEASAAYGPSAPTGRLADLLGGP